MPSHRSGLKKKHKAFKSRHATKGQIKNQNKGRIEKDSVQGHQKHVLSKQERKNHAEQVMTSKRKSAEAKARIFQGKGGCPRNICLVPLTGDIDTSAVVHQFEEELGGTADPTISSSYYFSRFKTNLRFFQPDFTDFYGVLDTAKSADFVLFILSAQEEIGDYGEKLVRCISSQGCPTAFGLVWGFEGDKKVKTSLTSWFSHFFADSRLFLLSSELATCANSLSQRLPSGISWREERAYIVAERAEVNAQALAVEGVVRGAELDINQLLHLPGVGDCQIAQIVAAGDSVAPSDPASLDPLAEDEIEMNEWEVDDVSAAAGVRIEGHEYVSEIIDADEDIVQTIKKVPQGMSEYQASWLIEGEDYGLSGEDASDEDMLDDVEGELVAHGAGAAGPRANGANGAVDDDAMYDEIDGDDSDASDAEATAAYRRSARLTVTPEDDVEYPDEVDFEPTESLKDRLSRYRGVRDLRTTQWDANERDSRAPAAWPRLVRPGNLFATKNRILKEQSKEATEKVAVGTRVTIYLAINDAMRQCEAEVASIPQKVAQGRAVALYGLLRHESKLANINMSINTDSEFNVPLKGKQPIIVQYGPRRLVVQPIYSTPGAKADNDVYKMFRYLHPGHPATVSTIAPLMLTQAPVVYFTTDADPRLIGTGQIMDSNANRVIVKRVILSGHPYKINKKVVTVRHMFFNNRDVHWFKNVPLFTTWGCSGFIKESLGTHGSFKATFDKKINSQDAICMALYKRVWSRVASEWRA